MALQIHQPYSFLTAGQSGQEISLDLENTQNMNFKCWPSLLLVMDQRVVLRYKEQMKMVRNL